MERINEEEHRVEDQSFFGNDSQITKRGKKLSMTKNLSEQIVKIPKPRNITSRDSLVLKSVGNVQLLGSPGDTFNQPEILSTRMISTRMISTKMMVKDEEIDQEDTEWKMRM